MNQNSVRDQSDDIQEIYFLKNGPEIPDDDDIRVVYDSNEKDLLIANMQVKLEQKDARIREVQMERDAEIGSLMSIFETMKGKIQAKEVQIQKLEKEREGEVGDLMKVIEALKKEVECKNEQLASQTVLQSEIYKVIRLNKAVESENLDLKKRESESLKAVESMKLKCKAFENISLELDRHLCQRNAKVLELEEKLAVAEKTTESQKNEIEDLYNIFEP